MIVIALFLTNLSNFTMVDLDENNRLSKISIFESHILEYQNRNFDFIYNVER